MELNRRIQHVVEVLPTGPASPIWDLDGADSPIPSESCTMSTISDMGSSESTIGCSSPGLLPDPCLGSIEDLGDGLHGDSGLFDPPQVNCSFSGASDPALDGCEDSSDPLKHSDSYHFSECNSDILSCAKTKSFVFSESSALPSANFLTNCKLGPAVNLQDQSCLGLPVSNLIQGTTGGINSITCPSGLTVNTSQATSFSVPVLLSSSPGNPVGVTGALTVININLPLLNSHAATASGVKVQPSNLGVNNLLLLPGLSPVTLPLTTSYIQGQPTSCSLSDQPVSTVPFQSWPNLSTSVISSDTCKQPVSNNFPLVLNPLSTFAHSVPGESINGGELSTIHGNTAQNSVPFSSDCTFDSVPMDIPCPEIDTNRFLNLDVEGTSESNEKLICDSGKTDENIVKKNVTDQLSKSESAPITDSKDNQVCDLIDDSPIPTSEAQNCPMITESKRVENTDSVQDETAAESKCDSPVEKCTIGSTCLTDANGKPLSITSIVRLIPAKKQPQIFKCDLCSATFNRLGNYSRHRMIHTVHVKDDFRYKCEKCDRLFLQKCDLKRHELIHEKKEPYKCSVCSKGYIRQSDLKVHMRFHNREKAFKCNYCDKSYYQSGDLNRHVRIVHLQSKMLTCGHCDQPYEYAKEATLIRHMQTKHKDIIRQSLNQKLSSVRDCNNTGQPKEVPIQDDSSTRTNVCDHVSGSKNGNYETDLSERSKANFQYVNNELNKHNTTKTIKHPHSVIANEGETTVSPACAREVIMAGEVIN